jgi:glycosyltransferase domain-containing protein
MELTILLTLKNRSEFTYRWLSYMNSINCKFKILIADGGNDIDLISFLNNKSNYPNLDYEYLKYPYDATIEDYYNKFKDALSKIKTKYLVLADNDDFFLLDRFDNYIQYLNLNSDYIGARGELVNLKLFDNNKKIKNSIFGKSYEAIIINSPTLEHENPLSRINFLCSNFNNYSYCTNWYCIFNTIKFSKIYNDLNSFNNKELLINEISINIMFVYTGKIKIFDEAFIVRQINTSSVGDNLIINNSFLERCINHNAFSDFNYLVDNILKIKDTTIKHSILNSIAAWLEIFIYNNRLERLYQKSNNFIFRNKLKKIPIFGKLIYALYLATNNKKLKFYDLSFLKFFIISKQQK